METVKEINLTSCWEETAPPRELTIKGSDGTVLLKATLVEPTWLDWQGTAAKMGQFDGAEQTVQFIHLCLNEWTLPDPISVANILRLHPLIFAALAEEALAVITVKAEQIKNSVPLSQSSGSQPSSERAESLTETLPASGPTGS